MVSCARKDRKFDSGLGGGALLDIGIYNLGFLRILPGTGEGQDTIFHQYNG